MAGPQLSEPDLAESPTDDRPSDGEGFLRPMKAISLVLTIAASMLENTAVLGVIFRHHHLHRAPFYLLVNMCVLDLLRTVVCLPWVLTVVLHGAGWPYSQAACKGLGFASTLLTFSGLFCLVLMAGERHMTILHPHMHSQHCSGVLCVGLMVLTWGVALLLALPPTVDLGTYAFLPGQAQCGLLHQHHTDNDTLAHLLITLAVLVGTAGLYIQIFRFLRAHRRMRPIMVEPVRSHNWSFVPGGLAANNMIAGVARAVTNPAALGHQQQPHMAGRMTRQLVRGKERLTQGFVAVTITYTCLWLPYIILSVWQTLDYSGQVSLAYVSLATWLSYVQVAVSPLVYVGTIKPLQKAILGASSQSHRNRNEDIEETHNFT